MKFLIIIRAQASVWRWRIARKSCVLYDVREYSSSSSLSLFQAPFFVRLVRKSLREFEMNIDIPHSTYIMNSTNLYLRTVYPEFCVCVYVLSSTSGKYFAVSLLYSYYFIWSSCIRECNALRNSLYDVHFERGYPAPYVAIASARTRKMQSVIFHCIGLSRVAWMIYILYELRVMFIRLF